jgi:hypothetical protein
MRVTTTLDVYEIDGEDTKITRPIIMVQSHWSDDDRIVLVIDGKERSVLADQLVAAVANARNWVRP